MQLLVKQEIKKWTNDTIIYNNHAVIRVLTHINKNQPCMYSEHCSFNNTTNLI